MNKISKEPTKIKQLCQVTPKVPFNFRLQPNQINRLGDKLSSQQRYQVKNNVRFEIQGRKIIGSHPSTSDTQYRGTPQSSLQNSEQSTPPQNKYEFLKNRSKTDIKTMINNKINTITHIPRILSAISQTQKTHIQTNCTFESNYNDIHHHIMAQFQDIKIKQNKEEKDYETNEVSFGEKDASLFQPKQTLRQSGRIFFVEENSQLIGLNNNNQHSKYKSNEKNGLSLEQSVKQHPSQTLIVSKQLPDIFMNPAQLKRMILFQEKKSEESQNLQYQLIKCQSQQIKKRSELIVNGKDKDKDNNNNNNQTNHFKTSRNENSPLVDQALHSKKPSNNFNLEPLQLPTLDTVREKKTFLQRKAQIKIINRIFSGKQS